MTWQPLDCHAHTTWSDGALTPAELVATVSARGVRPSISDHLSGDVASAVKTLDQVAAYLDDLDNYPVARGAEFCWHDALWREIPPELATRFTHRIGSLHAIFLGDDVRVHMFQSTLPEGMTPDLYMDAHVENLERFAREMPVDILAHPTLLPSPYRRLPVEDLWTEPREERAVEALRAAGIAFELSARYPPHRRFVQRALDAGVRFSLGSDGHAEEQVGDVGAPLALARAVGVRDADLYDPAVHGCRTADPSARAS